MEKRRIEKISQGRFMVAAAAASASGDAAGALSLPDGRLAFILSDGMGKGMKAAAESHLVIAKLRKLLKKGIAPSRAIKIVNNELIGDNEIFATIDLVIIDKNSGRACFYKMGAATSFLVRNGQVRNIEQAALPVGIIKKVKARQLVINLRPGDNLVMVSDGITEADKEDLCVKWLHAHLEDDSTEPGPRVMASEIVSKAQLKYGSRDKDDLTAVVIQIR